MQRKTFIKTLVGASTMLTLGAFKELTDPLTAGEAIMPVLFIGHGSPMNGIEDNEFSQGWRTMAKSIPTPKAIVVVSAHWLTRGTFVTAMDTPRTIHDFGGFPKELHEVQYPAPGQPTLALETSQLVTSTKVGLDHEWGLDHGAWTVVRQMYPEAQIPVLQFSIDYHKPAQYHYDLAKELSELRKKGVLLIGSGNMIHNLGMVAWDKLKEPDYGYDWAIELNNVFKQKITEKDHKSLIEYEKLGTTSRLAIPTPDHYYPLLYSLGLQSATDEVSFFNDRLVGGSLNMTSVKISAKS
jgi:4,5-DOPA dioxygenase extradiol